jgi:lysozyme family protein
MADINKLIPIVLRWEGGYVDDPLDRGGPTNRGVTLATYRRVFGKNKTADDLKNISDDEWRQIIKASFWDVCRGDTIRNQSIANLIVDWTWGSGVYGIRYTQQVVGVEQDGVFGVKTLNAINGYPDQKELFDRLWQRRRQHFEAIAARDATQQRFLKGWLNRLNDFKFKEK